MEEQNKDCVAKFTVTCLEKKIEKLRIKGNHEAFENGILMKSIDNEKWTLENALTFPLDFDLEFQLEVLDNEDNVIEKELEENQMHKIKLTENSMDLQWTYGIDFVDNEVDWDKILEEQEKAFNEAKDESEKLLQELQEKNQEQAKQMEEFAESMKQQQEMINEINGSLTEYTSKVTELADKNKAEMEEFEKQKELYLEEMKKLEEEQRIALENLKLADDIKDNDLQADQNQKVDN